MLIFRLYKIRKQIHNLTFSRCINKNPEKNLPEPPTTCCMSGCANCVWLEYAEKLTKYFCDGGIKAIEEIQDKIEDPSIRSFVLHELRMRLKQQEEKEKNNNKK